MGRCLISEEGGVSTGVVLVGKVPIFLPTSCSLERYQVKARRKDNAHAIIKLWFLVLILFQSSAVTRYVLIAAI